MDVSSERAARRNTGVSKRREGRARDREALFCVLSALWGLVTGMASLPFGADPFGFAALAVSSRYALGVAVGLAASCALTESGYALLGAYGVTLILRVAFSLFAESGERAGHVRRLLCEGVALRMVSAAAGALTIGIYRFVRGGYLYYYVIGAVIAMVVSAALVLLWSAVAPDRADGGRRRGAAWRTSALCSMAALVTYALSGTVLFGVSLPVFFALTFTLFATRNGGMAYGVLTAICTGVFVSAVYAPLFILAAVCFAALHKASLGLACFASLAVGMAWGVYMTGIAAVSDVFSGLLASSVIFPTVEKLFFSSDDKGKKTAAATCAPHSESATEERDMTLARFDGVCHRIFGLCGAFSALAEGLALTDEKFSCSPAKRRGAEIGGSVLARVDEEGAVIRKKTCRNRSRGKKRQSVEERELAFCDLAVTDGFFGGSDASKVKIYSSQLTALSEYLARAVSEAQEEIVLNEELTQKLNQGAGDRGFRLIAFGGDARRINAYADSEDALTQNKDKIFELIGNTLGGVFCVGDAVKLGEEYRMQLVLKPRLAAYAAGRRKSAPAEQDFCGDSFDVLRSEEGGVYAFICDGMGSGRDAARVSELSSVFFRRLLGVGVSARRTLEILNGFLRFCNCSSADENSVSTDIIRIDLHNGRANLLKSGAAPTYVFRDGGVIKFAARTLPVGIMKDIDAAERELDILAGDVIVMVSDGVTEGREECPELFEFIRSRLLTHTADQLAEAIIADARKRGCQDDVTAVVIRIEQESLAA